ASSHAGRIDVLLTDTVMPGLSGPDLAERLRSTRPIAVVIYMSGYTDHPAVLRAAEGGHAFLQKPFKPEALTRLVRQRLDGRRRESAPTPIAASSDDRRPRAPLPGPEARAS